MRCLRFTPKYNGMLQHCGDSWEAETEPAEEGEPGGGGQGQRRLSDEVKLSTWQVALLQFWIYFEGFCGFQ